MWPDGHRNAVRTNGSTVDPVDVVLYAGIVDEVTSGKVIGAVNNNVTTSQADLRRLNS